MKVGIVGLGLAGLSAAKHIAEAGHAVMGFDKFEALHTNGSSHGDSRIYRRAPFEGDEYVQLSGQAYPQWLQWNEEAGGNIFRQNGTLEMAETDHEDTHKALNFINTHGLAVEILNGAAVAQHYPHVALPAGGFGILQPTSGMIHPDNTMRFMARTAEIAGAQLRYTTPVAGLDGTEVFLQNGEAHKFDRVVVTAGAWNSRFVPALAPHTVADRQFLGWYRPKKGFEEAAAKSPVFIYWQSGVYGMPVGDGLMKIGLHRFGDITDPDNVRPLDTSDHAFMDGLVSMYAPGLEPKAEHYARCMYTVTPDHGFIIDRDPECENVTVISACSGHGAKFTPAFGQLALGMLEGDLPARYSNFKLSRFTHG